MNVVELIHRVDAPLKPRDDLARARADAEHALELFEREARSRRRAWVVASLLMIVCAVQAAAIALMLPLKEVTPYTIVVDRSSGLVEAARPVALGALPEDEAVTQALLAQYVVARETFDANDLASRYELVALWSAGTARSEYVAAYRADNPKNVVAATPSGVVRRVRVRGVQLTSLTGETKQGIVDFTLVSSNAAGLEQEQSYRAAISFRYSTAPTKMQDRWRNPLGFQVVAYRRDEGGALGVTTSIPDAPEQSADAPATANPLPSVIRAGPLAAAPPAQAAPAEASP